MGSTATLHFMSKINYNRNLIIVYPPFSRVSMTTLNKIITLLPLKDQRCRNDFRW